jgi:hypothetical protein
MTTNKKYILLSFCDSCFSTKISADCKRCNIKLCYNCIYRNDIFSKNLSICKECQSCINTYINILIKCIYCGTLTKKNCCGYCII